MIVIISPNHSNHGPLRATSTIRRLPSTFQPQHQWLAGGAGAQGNRYCLANRVKVGGPMHRTCMLHMVGDILNMWPD